MGYQDEKIDYTNYLKGKPQETDPEKISVMAYALFQALEKRGISFGDVQPTYYTDGRVLVCVNGQYYGVFDSNTGKFFSGYVGD